MPDGSKRGRQTGGAEEDTDGHRRGTGDWLPSQVTNYQVSANYQDTVARQAAPGCTPKVLAVRRPRLYSNV